MQKTSTALLVLMLFSSLGLWGCSQQKNGATTTKIKELEARHVKLEEDYRSVASANESNRRKIAGLETQRGELTLSASPAGDMLRLRVRDNGPGIDPSHLPLIFDRFYKADASRQAAGGSGLGLSIVKAIIERHGGSITVHNDDGAVFDILLPAARQAPPCAADNGVSSEDGAGGTA